MEVNDLRHFAGISSKACKLFLDDVEEFGPLGEDDGFGFLGTSRFLGRGFEDADEGFDFVTAGVDVVFDLR